MPPPRGPKAKEGGSVRLVFGFFFASLAVAVIHHNASYFANQKSEEVKLQLPVDTEGAATSNEPPDLISPLDLPLLVLPAVSIPLVSLPNKKPPAPLKPPPPVATPQPPQPLEAKAALKDFAGDLKAVASLYEGPHARLTPSAPKKITRREQEFLPEYQPCCDTRPKGRRPGAPDGETQMAAEDAWLRKHAAAYPYPTFRYAPLVHLAS